jgi:hypothetical protein
MQNSSQQLTAGVVVDHSPKEFEARGSLHDKAECRKDL